MGLSLAERDRRYAAIRELMKKDGQISLLLPLEVRAVRDYRYPALYRYLRVLIFLLI
ncbi:hypothetical protein ACFLXD_05020 [Chloroflexota bacterium]